MGLQDKHGNPCPYCTRSMDKDSVKLQPTRDHVKPKSKGLSIHPINPVSGKIKKYGRTIVVCSECNYMKADLTLEEFLQALVTKNKKLLDAVDTNIERMRNISFLRRIGLEE